MEITLRPTLKQHLVYEALKSPEIDTIFFGGGAGGGKTWLICESRLINCLRFPGYKSYIAREELKRLMQSTYQTWVKVCSFHKIPSTEWKLNGQYNYIEFQNGSRIDLLDVKLLPTDPFYERFGSLEYTDGAIEEAGEIEFLAYDVLKSRIGRQQGKDWHLKPTTLITGNPKKNWTYRDFYKPYKAGLLPPNIKFIQALFGDNQFTAEEYGKQLNQIKDKTTRERLMFGNWEYEDDPNALIQYDAIIDLFTNTVDPDRQKYLTADIARYGGDKIVIYCWEGWKIYKMFVYEKLGIDQTAEVIRNLLITEQIPHSHTIVDDDGVGGGVVDILRGIKGFVNNSSPLDNPLTHKKENYRNLKTQCYYMLAEKINNRGISVQCFDEKAKALLTEDLEQVKAKDLDKDGKLQLVGKDEVKEKIGRSPDYSDPLMMRMWFELSPKQGVASKQFVPGNLSRRPTYNIK